MRRTTLFFAPLTLAESLRLLASAPRALMRGVPVEQPERTRFEQEWCTTTGATAAIATPSARSGLYALLDGLGVGPGDEVLVTGFTCDAVPEPVQFLGAKPVYVDIDIGCFAMDPAAAAAAITPRTKAVIVQHTFGLPAPVDALTRLARDHGLFVIEDCALALGSRVEGKWLGTFGDAALFSFELSKTLTAGWGGLVQINRDAELAARLRAIRDRAGVLKSSTASRRLFQAGTSGLLYRPEVARWSGKLIGAFFRMGLYARSATVANGDQPPADYLAAPAPASWRILRSQLARLSQITSRRHATAARYLAVLDRHHCGCEALLAHDGVRLIRFPLLVHDRERFAQWFAEAGIESGRWFSQPVSCGGGDVSRYGYVEGTCPIAEFAARHIVNLPLHERMSDRDVEAAVDRLDRYLTVNSDEREFMRATREAATRTPQHELRTARTV